MKARTKGSILTASAIVAMIGSGAALSEGGDPQWKKALEARSEALNRQYGLGAWELKTSPAPQGDEPAWLRAMRLRSEALNQQYSLGNYAPRS